MKDEKLIEKIKENIKEGYDQSNILRFKEFMNGEETKRAAAELIDIIKTLEHLNDKLHWTDILGRDLISDYINDEISNMLNYLRTLKDQQYYQIAIGGQDHYEDQAEQ